MSAGFPRTALVDELASRIEAGATLLLGGSLGSGKSWLLRAVAERLTRAGRPPIQLDLLLAVASPERFAAAASLALARAAPHAAAPELGDVEAVLRALASSRAPLLLDEPTELRALASFPGLREIEPRFGQVLQGRPATLLASSFPTAAARLGEFESIALPPLGAGELAELAGEATTALLRLADGIPGPALALLAQMGESGDSAGEAWVAQMQPGAGLDRGCRAAWETLLLRSRGYAMSKAVLEAVALEEGLNLTALVGRLGRTPGAVRDYLGWLLEVDALRMVGKRYFFVDPLLRDWLRLNAGGHPPRVEALRAIAAERLGPDHAAPAPRPRHDALMEID